MNDDLTKLVSGLREQVEKLIVDIKSDPRMSKLASLHQALNTLEESCGMSKTKIADLFDFKEGMEIRPDEFFGLEPLEAAKRFLRKKGKAATFGEIASMLQAGGCEIKDEAELRLSLARSTRQVVKVGADLYGLTEFYPDMNRGRKKTLKDAIEAVANGVEVVETVDELVENGKSEERKKKEVLEKSK